MKAPDFWKSNRGGLLSTLLAPAGFVYGLGTAARQKWGKSWTCPIPLICVGNLVAGGAGKTPVVMDVARRVRQAGIDAHIITRGYGGTEKGPLKVSRELYDARAVGDEALILSEVAPTWVSDDRPAGCRRAMTEGAGLVVLDDGFQDPSCRKSLSILVVDGACGFGNARIIPAGPLRESVKSGLQRADGVAILGEDRANVGETVGNHCPVLRATIEVDREFSALEGEKVLAFAGIGVPDKFFRSARAHGLDVVKTEAFADHHHFTDRELARLSAEAEMMGATLLTTTKDLVRLPPDMREAVKALPVHVVWDNEEEINQLLNPVIADALA